jgi:hypothetical protein
MRDAGTVAVPSALQRTGPPDADRPTELETPALERDERERRDDQQREELPQRRVEAVHLDRRASTAAIERARESSPLIFWILR